MTKSAIIQHLDDWFFNLDGEKEFEKALKENKITLVTNSKYGLTVIGGSHGDADGSWITVNGSKIFIPDGTSIDSAIKERFEKVKSVKPKSTKPKEVKPSSTKDKKYTKENFKGANEVVESPSDARSNAMFDIHTESRKDGFIEQSELDRAGVKNTQEYMSNIRSSTLPYNASDSDITEINKRWDYIEKTHSDKPFMTKYNALKNNTDSFNTKLKSEYDTTPSFFRGSGTDELESYKSSGTIGGDKNSYGYVAVSTNPESAGKFGRGIMIEYDGDSVRNHGTLVDYSIRPQQSGTLSGLETIGKPMALIYGNEKEVRLPEGLKLDSVNIKNIHVDSSRWSPDEMNDRYGNLGNIVVHNNYDEWVLGFGGEKVVTFTEVKNE